jgi:uncharacterized phage-like protein YoqJ
MENQNQQLFIKTENNQENLQTCTFTGHRKLLEDFSKEKLEECIIELVEKGVHTFYCGMAIGFDLLAGELVVKLKEKYPFLQLVACVPFYGQEEKFSNVDKERYCNLLKKCDKVEVLSANYFRGCMQNRNRFMADKGDVLLAYCKKVKGGAAFTVNYYRKKYPQNQIIFV